jgi:hypothetical protein
MISFSAAEREPLPLHTFSQSGNGRGRRGNCCHLLNESDHPIVAAVRLIGSGRSADEYCRTHHIGDGNTLAIYAKVSSCPSL